MRVKYFAWVRERVGVAEETVEPPADVRTVNDLIGWLSSRGEAYAYAFEKPKVIRAAISCATSKSACWMRMVAVTDIRKLNRRSSAERTQSRARPRSRYRA